MAVSRKTLAWGVTWGAGVALTTGVLVHAFNPQPDPPGHYFGLMGIVAGQHVSVHVVNRKMAVDAFRPGDTCRADIRLMDSRGATMLRRVGTIVPGASMSLNFTSDPPSDLGCLATTEPPEPDRPGQYPPDPCRTLVRVLVLFKRQASHCMSSVEVTNQMGTSMGFMNPGDIVGFNPQPDPPGAPTKR